MIGCTQSSHLYQRTWRQVSSYSKLETTIDRVQKINQGFSIPTLHVHVRLEQVKKSNLKLKSVNFKPRFMSRLGKNPLTSKKKNDEPRSQITKIFCIPSTCFCFQFPLIVFLHYVSHIVLLLSSVNQISARQKCHHLILALLVLVNKKKIQLEVNEHSILLLILFQVFNQRKFETYLKKEIIFRLKIRAERFVEF